MMGAAHLLTKGSRDLGDDSKAARHLQSPLADGNSGKAAARLRSEGCTCGQDSALVALSGQRPLGPMPGQGARAGAGDPLSSSIPREVPGQAAGLGPS